MWPWQPEPLLLDLKPDGMGWVERQADGELRAQLRGWDPAAGLSACRDALVDLAALVAAAGPPGAKRPLRVRLAGDLALHWIQAPFEGGASLADWHTAASLRAARLFGGSAAGYWVAGDWQWRRPFLCLAADARWCATLQATWDGPVQLTSLVSEHLRAFASLWPRSAWAVLDLADRLQLLYWANGALHGLSELRLASDPMDSAERVAAAARRMLQLSLREGWESPSEVVWINPMKPAAPVAAASGSVRLKVALPPGAWGQAEDHAHTAGSRALMRRTAWPVATRPQEG